MPHAGCGRKTHFLNVLTICLKLGFIEYMFASHLFGGIQTKAGMSNNIDQLIGLF